MAISVNNTLFGANNPITAQKNDTEALTAWNQLQILNAEDLNGFIQWVQKFVRAANNEIANALTAFDITPNPDVYNQLARLLQALENEIANAASAGALIGSYWFGLTGNTPSFEVPNPTDAQQNYFDFTTNTPYTAKADLTGWNAGSPITPPADKDARIAITNKFWDIAQTNNTGGFAFWSYTSQSWSGFAPIVVDWNNVNLTGTPTAPTPTGGSPDNQIATKAYVDGMTGAVGQVQPGTVVAHAANTTSLAGYLLCDGSAVSRTTYPALFASIGTTYGAGDGTTTFNLPDYRGAFLRGYGTGTNASTDEPSWCTSGEIGSVAQFPSVPNITGMVAGQGNTNNISANTGCFSPRSNQVRAGDIGSGFPFYSWQNNFDASVSDISYGRRERDVAPFNYAVQFFIKY